jgi:hypothetical protein
MYVSVVTYLVLVIIYLFLIHVCDFSGGVVQTIPFKLNISWAVIEVFVFFYTSFFVLDTNLLKTSRFRC